MKFSKEQIFSAVRHLISGVGGILIARGIATETLMLDISGCVMGILAIYWSIKEKDFTVTKFEGTFRQILTFLGGFFAFLTPDVVNQVIGAVMFLVPLILGQTDKEKVQEPKIIEPAPVVEEPVVEEPTPVVEETTPPTETV